MHHIVRKAKEHKASVLTALQPDSEQDDLPSSPTSPGRASKRAQVSRAAPDKLVGEAGDELSPGANRLKKTVSQKVRVNAMMSNMRNAIENEKNIRQNEGTLHEARLGLPELPQPASPIVEHRRKTFQGQALKTPRKSINPKANPKATAAMARLSSERTPREADEHFPVPVDSEAKAVEKQEQFKSPMEHFNLANLQEAGQLVSKRKTVSKVVSKMTIARKSMAMSGSSTEPTSPKLEQSSDNKTTLGDAAESEKRIAQILSNFKAKGRKSGKGDGSDCGSSDSEVFEGNEPTSPKSVNPVSFQFGDTSSAKSSLMRLPVGSAAKKMQQVMRQAEAEAEKQRLQPNFGSFQQPQHIPLPEPAPPVADSEDDGSVTAQEILVKLAREFVEKFGSLKHAFKFFDSSNSGNISTGEWQSGMQVAHLNLEEIVGVTAATIFRWIGIDGRISLEAWQTFFEQLEKCSAEDAAWLHEDRGSMRQSRSDAAHASRWKNSSLKGLAAFAGRGTGPAAEGTSMTGWLDSSPPQPGTAVLPTAAMAAAPVQQSNPSGSPTADAEMSPQDVSASSEITPPTRQSDGSPTVIQPQPSAASADQEAVSEGKQPHDQQAIPLRSTADTGLHQSSQPAADAGGAGQQPAGDAAESLSPRSLNQGAGEMPSEAAPSDSESSSESSSSGEELSALQSAPDASKKINQARLPKPSLKAVMSGKAKVEDVADPEMSIAQQQLKKEIAEMDLSGVQALAYVLAARFKSLRKAFRWFDVTNHEHINHNMWDTGLKLLRIDLESLTGFKTHLIFQMLDRGKQGFITKSDWKAFFAKIDVGDFKSVLKRAGKSDKKKDEKLKGGNNSPRKKRRKPTLGQDESKNAGNADGEDADASDSDGAAEGSDAKRGKGRRRRRGRDGGSESDDEDCIDDPSRRRGKGIGFDGLGGEEADQDGSSSTGHGVGAGMGAGSSKESFGDLEAGRGGSKSSSDARRSSSFFRRPSQEEAMLSSFREQIRIELKKLIVNECKEYSTKLGPKKVQIICEVAEELGLWTHVQEQQAWGTEAASTARMAPCVLVGHVRKFTSQTETRLRGIKTGESFEFPSTLSFEQRRIVHLLAAKLGLFTRSEGKGSSRKVVACNVGSFADEVREQLEELQPGEGKAFPSTLTGAERKVVHSVAAELGMWCHTQSNGDSTYVEVYNLAEFVDEIREALERLSSGEEKEFPSSFTEAQRKVVHLISGELGLVTVSQGEGSSRFVSAANLVDFRKIVLQELQALEPNQSKLYSDLTVLMRKTVIDVANTLQLRSNASLDDSNAHRVEVWGAGTENQEKKAETEDAEEEEDSESWAEEDEDSEQAMIGRLFEQYATGSWNGQRIFLRFPDLLEFVEDMRDLMPNRCNSFRQKLGAMENIYEDTLQLQMDLGLKASKGLTLKYFMVFIQKVLSKLGWAYFGLLTTLLDEV